MVKHKNIEKEKSKDSLHKTAMYSKDRFKKEIAKPLSNMLQTCTVQQIESLIEPSKNACHEGQFHLAFPKLEKLIYASEEIKGSITAKEFCQTIEKLFKSHAYIDKVSSQGQFLNFNVHQAEYIKQTLASILDAKEDYGRRHNDNKVLIDFSSPNIVKPYADYLRSTLLGHFVRNIYQSQGYSTIASTYFGDWREQYGLLAVGFKKYHNDIEEYEKNPVKVIHRIYTKITKDMKSDKSISIAVLEEQDKLNKGERAQQEQWLDFRTRTLNKYKEIYQRLGIEFDNYCGEGEFHPVVVPTLITTLRKLNLLIEEESVSYVDLSTYPYDNNTNLGKAVLVYKDNTYSFLAREIACLLYRLDKYNDLEKVIYVAGIDQERHFKQTFQIVKLILLDQELPELQHITFGKMEGLSLEHQGIDDLLDKGKERMIKTMKEDLRNGKYQNLLEQGIQTDDHHWLKGEETVEYIADQLGISAMIVQDMSAKRTRGYQFNCIMDARGDTGVFLQYTYARICGIQRKMNFQHIPHSYRPSLLREKEAFELMYTASLYPDVLLTAFQTMDPCPLVLYLFRLSHLISQTNYSLRVKDVEKKLSEARLCLFEAAKITLANGMKIIGLKPLERM